MSKTRVLITDGLAKEGIDLLRASGNFEIELRKATTPDELANIIGDYDSIVIRSATTLTADLIKKATNMKLIVRAGAGVDNIDVPTATAGRIPVMNTASANSLAAAEQTIALLFSVMRHIPQSAAALKLGKWDRGDAFKGYEVTGKTMAVLGLGNIGRIVAEKAIGLGMKVVGYDPMIKSLSQVQGKLAKMDDAFTLVTTVDEAVSLAHVVTVHVPKNKETTNLINASRIAMMKDKGFVLNCARGGIVNEEAVLAAIDSGKLAGAAFDVYEKEPPAFPNALFIHPKIVCAAHLGASTFEAQERVALTAAAQMVGFFSKGDRTGVIN